MARFRWAFLALFYLVIAAVIYSPSLSGPWQYDDHSQILDKEVLLVHSAPEFFLNVFKFFPEANGRLTNRDLVRASFRLNWDWWGNNPLGYRWVNLLIHIANSTLVALLIWLLFAYNNYKNKVILSDESARSRRIQRSDTNIPIAALDSSSKTPQNDELCVWVSVFAGLLFLVHPIQSQAVAYTAQRFTSMATMFYLAAVISWLLFLRLQKLPFTVYSLLFAILAFSSKEISITLPVVLILLTCFIGRQYNNYKNYNRYKIYLLLLPFFLFSLKVPLQLFWSSFNFNAGFQANQTFTHPETISEAFSLKQTAVNLSRHDYFLTQINVVRTYQRLLILPFGQTLDWDYPLTTVLDAKTIITLISHISLITLGVFLLLNRQFSVIARSPESVEGRRGNLAAQPDRHAPSGLAMTDLQLIGVGILWFYITLLPESSFIPIIDVIYEHRVYLPMVGVCLAFASAVNWAAYNFYNFYNRYKFYILAAAAFYFLVLSVFTFNRAYVWGDQIRLWADTAVKAPRKARTNKNYGVVLAAGGRYEEGIKYLLKAIELKPDDADYHSNLGTAYLRSGKYQLAADQFQMAYDLYLKDNPWLSNPPNPSNPSDVSGDKGRQTAAQYLNDFGVANVQMGNGKEALEAFKKALEINPGLYSARLGLGAAYNVVGDQPEAIKVFSQLVKDYPDQTDALNNLAVVYEKAGQLKEAYAALIKLQSIQSNYPNIKERIKKLEKLLL